MAVGLVRTLGCCCCCCCCCCFPSSSSTFSTFSSSNSSSFSTFSSSSNSTSFSSSSSSSSSSSLLNNGTYTSRRTWHNPRGPHKVFCGVDASGETLEAAKAFAAASPQHNLTLVVRSVKDIADAGFTEAEFYEQRCAIIESAPAQIDMSAKILMLWVVAVCLAPLFFSSLLFSFLLFSSLFFSFLLFSSLFFSFLLFSSLLFSSSHFLFLPSLLFLIPYSCFSFCRLYSEDERIICYDSLHLS